MNRRVIRKITGGAAAVLAIGMNGLAAESMPSDNPGAGKSRFIDTHVHFQDCRQGDLDKVAEWMKSNHVQRCINHPLTAVR
jgi:hypothetical protein